MYFQAYARAPVLTVNGSDDGFDGFRIGVESFYIVIKFSNSTE